MVKHFDLIIIIIVFKVTYIVTLFISIAQPFIIIATFIKGPFTYFIVSLVDFVIIGLIIIASMTTIINPFASKYEVIIIAKHDFILVNQPSLIS